MVGWRKNDASSLMVGSTGGQAISLLCSCLSYALKREQIRFRLSGLCTSMLSRDSNIASVSQLPDAAEILAAKLGAVGIGNLVAREVSKLNDTFKSMSRAVPRDFLDRVQDEAMKDMLQDVSSCLLQEKKLCRISESESLSSIIGLFQVQSHEDLLIIVHGQTFHPAVKPKIIIETINDTSTLVPQGSYYPQGTKWGVETLLDSSQGQYLPLKTLSRSSLRPLPLEIGFT